MNAYSSEYEKIVRVRDGAVGLRAIVAIHDTRLGPAVGGCRMWPYSSEDEALRDALALSRAMTLKCAMAGLPFGGGKSVILGDPVRDKTDALLERFGRFVDGFAGEYLVAEDVGIGSRDVEVMARSTRHVVGLPDGLHASGDPSPFTALGVLEGMRVGVRRRLSSELAGTRVAIQGVGAVGMELCRLLHAEGAGLVVADPVEPRARTAAERFGAAVVAPASIHAADADVFAPCALGGVLDDRAVPGIRAAVVAGAANVQLAAPRHADALHRRGVLYAPDFVINAGGVINGSGEILGRYDAAEARRAVLEIGPRLDDIFARAAEENLSPARVAEALAGDILNTASSRV